MCSSIISALEGRFGDFHRNGRTLGSELFINPLMPFYWCFRLEAVAKRILYLEGMRNIETINGFLTYLQQFQASCPSLRQPKLLPM